VSKDRRPLLILRPNPVAQRSLDHAAALGLNAHSLPLFAARAIAWAVPDPSTYDALLITSAQSLRLGGAGLRQLLSLPVYAVGAASAAAATQAGFQVAGVGDSDGKNLIADMQAQGIRSILWLTGRENSALDGGTAALQVLPCYAVDRIKPPDAWQELIREPAVIMAHSTRAAQYLAELIADARGHLTVIAISAKVAAAAGSGWAELLVADQPTDAAMLAVATKLCHKRGQ
jgi:uroporphyrinogen-III synthase